jgi:urease accessory protein
MKNMSYHLIRATAFIVLLAAAGLAQAHTGHGSSGVAEGLAHPLGADHLLAMLAVGLWSVTALPADKAWRGPATFLLVLIASATFGAVGIRVPYLEQMVSLSVVLFGAMLVMSRMHLPEGLGLGLVAIAASLHGLAHGAETPPAGFATYALGFLATTASLHFGGVAVGLAIRKYLAATANWAMLGLGSLCAASGLYLFNQL